MNSLDSNDWPARACGGSLRTAPGRPTRLRRPPAPRSTPPTGANASAPGSRSPQFNPAPAVVRRYLGALRRRWWLPTGLVAVAIGAQLTLDFVRPRQFVATTQLWMAGALVVPKAAYFVEQDDGFLATQSVLLRSPRVLSAAAERLGGAVTRDNLPDIDIEPVKKSSMLQVTSRSDDADRARAFLQSLVQSYFEFRRREQAVSRDDTAGVVLEELGRRERELRGLEEQRAAAASTNSLGTLQQERAAASAYLARVRQELGELRLQQQWLASVPATEIFEWSAGMQSMGGLGQVQQASRWVPLTDSDITMYVQTRDELKVLRVQRDDFARVLKDKHPKLVALGQAIEQREALVTSLATQGAAQVADSQSAVERQILGLEGSLRTWENRLIALNGRIAEAERLEIAIQRQRRTVDQLTETAQKVDMSRDLAGESLKSVGEPVVEEEGRWRPIRTAAALPLGLVSGVALVFGLEARRRSRLTPGRLPAGFERRLWATIPVAPRVGADAAPSLPWPAHPEAPEWEPFRELRASLLRETADAPARVLLFMGLDAATDVTTVVTGLGAALAMTGKRVLVLDANLRQPTLHARVAQAPVPGLADVLEHAVDWRALVRPAGVPGLAVMMAGVGSGTGDLVARPAWGQCVREARADYDHVLAIAPGISACADVWALAPGCDGVVLVADPDRCDPRDLVETAGRLRSRELKVPGWILVGATD